MSLPLYDLTTDWLRGINNELTVLSHAMNEDICSQYRLVMLVQLDVESVSRMPSEAGNAFHTFITTLTYTQPVFLVEHVQSGLYLGGTLTALPAV